MRLGTRLHEHRLAAKRYDRDFATRPYFYLGWFRHGFHLTSLSTSTQIWICFMLNYGSEWINQLLVDPIAFHKRNTSIEKELYWIISNSCRHWLNTLHYSIAMVFVSRRKEMIVSSWITPRGLPTNDQIVSSPFVHKSIQPHFCHLLCYKE